ncbi:hypothetical protein EXN66_Car020402 [Channa argus]|uniref:Uncharacterized protein n=1 Tax=Channa argus TaxID=215402 RepID=A0A6G1QQ39_CHAAH|nr:hypothetical protein EXN66_Car020402 [Channa argus]
MGAVGVLLISVLAVCLAKASCLAGGGTNERQNSGPHRTLRDVENSIEKALRLFHSVKTELLRAKEAQLVAENPGVDTATTLEANSPLANPSTTLSSYDAATVLVADAPAGDHDATTAFPTLVADAPAGDQDATTAFPTLVADAPAGDQDATTAFPTLVADAPAGDQDATTAFPTLMADAPAGDYNTLSAVTR